jgi:hypothetical protein
MELNKNTLNNLGWLGITFNIKSKLDLSEDQIICFSLDKGDMPCPER